MTIAGRLWLCLRVTISYLAGVYGAFLAASATGIWGEDDFFTGLDYLALLGGAALVVSLPLYLIAVALALVYAESVTERPGCGASGPSPSSPLSP